MLEIDIRQDSTKVANSRSSTQILDFLGDIGGFKEALLLILVSGGEYFSARFFIATVAKELYITKTPEHKKYESKAFKEDQN